MYISFLNDNLLIWLWLMILTWACTIIQSSCQEMLQFLIKCAKKIHMSHTLHQITLNTVSIRCIWTHLWYSLEVAWESTLMSMASQWAFTILCKWSGTANEQIPIRVDQKNDALCFCFFRYFSAVTESTYAEAYYQQGYIFLVNSLVNCLLWMVILFTDFNFAIFNNE